MTTKEIAQAVGKKTISFFGFTFMYDSKIKNTKANIYLFYDKYFKRYKVGMTTKQVVARKQQIEQSTGSEMLIVGEFPGYKINEKKLHAELKKYRLKGEWYKDDENVVRIFNDCELAVLSGYHSSDHVAILQEVFQL